jgi:hypothetical protein
MTGAQTSSSAESADSMGGRDQKVFAGAINLLANTFPFKAFGSHHTSLAFAGQMSHVVKV